MWFQNRRAKTKTQARKAEQAKALTTEGAGKSGDGEDGKGGKEKSEGSASAPIDLTDKNAEKNSELDELATPPPDSPSQSPSPSISLVVDDSHKNAVTNGHASSNSWGDFPGSPASFSGRL